MHRLVASVLLLLSISISMQAAAAPSFLHCSDFGCKSTREIRFEAEQWRQIRQLFEHEVDDSASEKQALRRAIALMERFSGEISGTHLDKAGNYPGADIPGQMDCIDESTNTYQYLFALQELGLLHWHRVDQKQRRIVWFITHWTATIREIDSGRIFAVDSWYRDNGELPYLQPLPDWTQKRDFPALFNPELAAN